MNPDPKHRLSHRGEYFPCGIQGHGGAAAAGRRIAQPRLLHVVQCRGEFCAAEHALRQRGEQHLRPLHHQRRGRSGQRSCGRGKAV